MANQATRLAPGVSLVSAEVVDEWDEVGTLHGPDEPQTLEQERDGMCKNGDWRESFYQTPTCSLCCVSSLIGSPNISLYACASW